MKIFFIISLFLLFSSSALAQNADAPLKICVTIPPQKNFVEKIGEKRINVTVMLPAGGNLHSFEPKPSKMISLEKAHLYVIAGDPSEAVWIKRFSSGRPNLKIIDPLQGITLAPPVQDTHKHDEKEHNDADLHTWLSPKLVTLQAINIHKALCEADPEGKKEYDVNLKKFLDEIVTLEKQLKEIISRIPENKRRFLCLHPSYGYFAKEFGLTQIPIEAEGKEPKPRQLAETVSKALALDIKIILVQPGFSNKIAQVVAEKLGATIVNADPMAENWAANLLQLAENLEKFSR